MIDAVRGTIIPAKNINALWEAMKKLVSDKEYYPQLRQNIRKMIVCIVYTVKRGFNSVNVDHLTFILDIKILALTIQKVFRSEGISSDTSVTMEKFSGD